MSLVDAFATPPSRRRGTCGMGRVIAALPEKDAQALNDVLSGDRWSSADIARVLRDEGHDVREWTVSRHRKGECACGAD